MSRLEFTQTASFLEWAQGDHSLAQVILIGLNLAGRSAVFTNRSVTGLLLLGCQGEPELFSDLTLRGALHFPQLSGLPYQTYRSSLYTVDELFDPPTLIERCRQNTCNAYLQTLDGQIYEHFCQNGRNQPLDIVDSLAQRLHDQSITDRIGALIRGRCVVGIMGGHSLQRSDPAYHQIAFLARSLTQEGFFLTSGGGPGAMEACHLGAHFVDRSSQDLEVALVMLEAAPDFKRMNDWLRTALEVKEKFPAPDLTRSQSLGVPTWYYGHEPPNVFASAVGKYFSNSVREDGLVTIARHGLVFAPGSAGTIQEIFQDQTQNFYQTEGEPSPMVLLGDDFWKWRRPIYPLLCSMASGKDYGLHLHITDSNETVLDILKRHRETRSV